MVVSDNERPGALPFDVELSETDSGNLPQNWMLVPPTESLHGLSLQIDLPPSPANHKRSRPLFQFLISRFIPQLIRPTADGQMRDELNRRSLALAFEHPFCMHALLACCGAEIPSNDPEYHELARYHYTHAVTGLRKILDDGALKDQWVVTMLGIMMLCIYERTKQKPSPGVAIHIAGAAQLMRLHSQTNEDSVEYSGVGQVMYRLVHESFIFHVTTSLPFQGELRPDDHALSTTSAYQYEIESALSMAEEALSDHFHEDIFSQPTSPVLGFPPQLFRCIYTVYRLYQSSNFDQVSMQLCQRLENDLCRWDKRLEASSAELSSPDSSAQPSNEELNSTSTRPSTQALHESTLIGPKLYILGCRILLRRMKGLDLVSVEMGVEDLTHQGMSMIQRLQPKKDYYADYYCWPFLAIGMNLRSSTDREMLLAKALAFCKATNNPTMRRLIDMLPVYWQSGD
ncbi:C6 finger domain protein [Penicillium subrubescens]|nr:C6 finger domain protein [Penicillium subrubescens]KAJ5907290.1 C6 finger domain protein [Penicillium subrubescens]